MSAQRMKSSRPEEPPARLEKSRPRLQLWLHICVQGRRTHRHLIPPFLYFKWFPHLQCPSICQRSQVDSWNFYPVFCENKLGRCDCAHFQSQTHSQGKCEENLYLSFVTCVGNWHLLICHSLGGGRNRSLEKSCYNVALKWINSWLNMSKEIIIFLFLLFKHDQTINKDVGMVPLKIGSFIQTLVIIIFQQKNRFLFIFHFFSEILSQ